ncbi:MAG: hypothetical protein CYPHOPRED_001699 [Cyphobasidiales sp. Tagirdzhanova-0007]|nr:MAG: hypothetical protein CYPHOPRED_001699 [Cyphobasidiales sp. Tagirdzhanova-0007]
MDFLQLLVGLTLLSYVFDTYLGQRQLAKLRHSAPPATLQAYFSLLGDSSNFLPSQNYLSDKLRFGQVAGLVDLVESAATYTTLLSIVSAKAIPVSGLKAIWDYAGTYELVIHRGEIAQSLAFAVLVAAASMITSVPASLYRTFVLEEKHGFNKTTFQTWLLDLVKSQLLTAVLGLPLIAALLKTIDYAGPSFVNYTMLLIISIQLIMIPTYPYLIAPIFNKYKAIHEFKDKENYVTVAKRIEGLAQRLDFPLGRLWVMDGSTRSSHSNAFFFGLPFLTKHIVLYDTLLDQNTPEEVEAVLAHELGHWKFNHSLIMLLISQAITFVNLSMIRLTLFNPSLYRSFSFTHERPLIIGLLLSMSLLGPLDTIISFLMNAISRKNEFQADRFAFDLSDAEHHYAEKLKIALVRLGDKNKSVTDVDGLWSAFKHSHPTMPERIDRLDQLLADEAKKN